MQVELPPVAARGVSFHDAGLRGGYTRKNVYSPTVSRNSNARWSIRTVTGDKTTTCSSSSASRTMSSKQPLKRGRQSATIRRSETKTHAAGKTLQHSNHRRAAHSKSPSSHKSSKDVHSSTQTPSAKSNHLLPTSNQQLDETSCSVNGYNQGSAIMENGSADNAQIMKDIFANKIKKMSSSADSGRGDEFSSSCESTVFDPPSTSTASSGNCTQEVEPVAMVIHVSENPSDIDDEVFEDALSNLPSENSSAFVTPNSTRSQSPSPLSGSDGVPVLTPPSTNLDCQSVCDSLKKVINDRHSSSSSSSHTLIVDNSSPTSEQQPESCDSHVIIMADNGSTSNLSSHSQFSFIHKSSIFDTIDSTDVVDTTDTSDHTRHRTRSHDFTNLYIGEVELELLSDDCDSAIDFEVRGVAMLPEQVDCLDSGCGTNGSLETPDKSVHSLSLKMPLVSRDTLTPEDSLTSNSTGRTNLEYSSISTASPLSSVSTASPLSSVSTATHSNSSIASSPVLPADNCSTHTTTTPTDHMTNGNVEGSEQQQQEQQGEEQEEWPDLLSDENSLTNMPLSYPPCLPVYHGPHPHEPHPFMYPLPPSVNGHQAPPPSMVAKEPSDPSLWMETIACHIRHQQAHVYQKHNTFNPFDPPPMFQTGPTSLYPSLPPSHVTHPYGFTPFSPAPPMPLLPDHTLSQSPPPPHFTLCEEIEKLPLSQSSTHSLDDNCSSPPPAPPSLPSPTSLPTLPSPTSPSTLPSPPSPPSPVTKVEDDSLSASVLGERHLLNNSWVMWFDRITGSHKDQLANYENSLTSISTIKSIEDFWSVFNHIPLPSTLVDNTNYHFFKEGIKPLWEDKANKHGGKWVLNIKPNGSKCLDTVWQEMLLMLIGGWAEQHDMLNGIVVSRRKKVNRISLWTMKRNDNEANINICKEVLKCLVTAFDKSPDDVTEFLKDIADGNGRNGLSMAFMHHKDSLKSGNSYTNEAHLKLKDFIEDVIQEF